MRLFRKKSDLQVVGESSLEDTPSRRDLPSPCDVLVMDTFAPEEIDLLDPEDCFDSLPMKVLLIGMEDDPEEFLAAVRSGVTGYLLKDASACDVVSAVRSAARNEAVCPAKLCMGLFRVTAEAARRAETIGRSETRPDLTIRQQQLVSLVAKGLTNKEIASQLNLSEFTVRNHIHRIFKQVDAGSRSEAVEVVRAHGYSLER